MLFCFAVLLVFSTKTVVASCPNPANPITVENCQAGNPSTDWDISGAGDSTIQGFATDISVNKGETVHFKVDTTASTFRIDIYRLGYYSGQGARLQATLPTITGQDQPNCLIDSTTGLIDCGNWAESASWAVPTTAVSGIYIAKLTRTDTGGASHIAFIVRDDLAPSDLLFQTSDTTWQAYNTYGGNSLYVGGPGTNPSRAYKVSYNRPITTRGTSAEDWLFNAEYPMVRWLEANGYFVTYATGVDTDRFGATDLVGHKIFLSVGHDEYWSGPQRANVEAARNAGINLAFFSGNEVFWKTRWEASIDGTNTPYRTLVSYKETHANAPIDPKDPPTWTGTWRDPRFSPPADGGRPENALTGTIFTVNCCTTTAAIMVPQQFATQPFWRNTRIATLPTGGTATLTVGTLGYEWDENLNNGFRPAGLTTLSSTTLNVQQKLQDYGSTYAAGSATHVLTLYRHTSNALVFGAGTVQWSWGLDGNHDRGLPGSTPDLAMQQATVNLFADMSAQPGSLQTGLVPGVPDTTAPTVTMTAPANGATVSGTTVTVSANANDNVGVFGVQFKLDGANLGAEDTTSPYSVVWNTTTAVNGSHTLSAVARDTAGNTSTSTAVTVTVSNAPDTTAPTVTMTAPANGATVSGTTVTVSATASDNVGIAGVQFLLDGVALGAEVTSAPYAVTWNTTSTSNGTHSLAARARDAAGNQTTSTAVSVTVANGVGGGVAMDAVATRDQSSAQNTVTVSAVSTTAANELLLAFIATDYLSGANTTVTGVTGAGLTWQLVVRTNVQRGTSEIWRAFALAPLSNASITATLSQSVSASVTVVSFKGVDPSGTNGSGAIGATRSANAKPGAPTATLTTTRNGSWVFGVGNDYDNAIARTLGPNQTMVHQFLSSVGDTYWVQSTAGPITTSGTNVTLNDTVPSGDRYNFSLCEIRPPINTDTTAPTVTLTAPANGATVSGTTVPVSANANDNVGVVGVQFKLDGVNLGAEVSSSPYTMQWNTTTAVNGSHTLSAVARDAAGNTATATGVTVTVSNVDTTRPTLTTMSPLGGTTSVSTSTTVTATFSEAMDAGTISTATVALRDSTSTSAVVPATVSYSAATLTATLTPATPLANAATYTATVTGGASGVKDLAGNALLSDVTWSFMTAPLFNCPCSIWSPSATPARMEADTHAVELGVKFRADVDGNITGVRFYKYAQNTGTHSGSIWTTSGTQLATVTFTNESASGWQQADFAQPVAITANTIYVVSYHTNTGYYGVTEPGLTTAVDNAPLHALSDVTAGGNGVYVYGAGGAFPNQTYDATNYWVDVVFTPTPR
jgi:hypothetical protein